MSDKLQLPPTDVIYANAMACSAEIKRKAAAERIAHSLDLAVLNPLATKADVKAACELAKRYEIKSVCVTTSFVPFATLLTDRVCAVIGFPHGNVSAGTKINEALEAIQHGAKELDVVVNYGRFLDGDPDPMDFELAQIVRQAHQHGVLVKAILETCYYTPDQIRNACRLCVGRGVDFVKTSTGFAAGGATPEAVQIMLDAVAGKAQVKASGGIKNNADAVRYLDMGCTRIGSSKFTELLP